MKMTQDAKERTTTVAGTFHDNELWADAAGAQKFVSSAAKQVERAIVSHVAERFLAEHLQEVVAAINPQAVANLALVRAAQQVVEEVLHAGKGTDHPR